MPRTPRSEAGIRARLRALRELLAQHVGNEPLTDAEKAALRETEQLVRALIRIA